MNANSGSTSTTTSMRERLDEVLARVDRELERSDSPNATAGTAYVGGIAKLGANLDAYLLDVWRWINVRLQRDPDAIARGANPPILLDRATAGQLLFLLNQFVGSAVANEPEVRWVIAEAREGSALVRALELRNAIVHGRTTPDARSIRETLSRLRNALAPQLALLGGSR